jgi:hypothetical protein
MNSQISLTISLVMIVLFTIAVLSFAVNFGIDNNAAVLISDDAGLSGLKTNTISNISTFKEDSEDTYSSIVSTTVEPGSDVVRSSGSFSVTWGNVFGMSKNIIKVGYQKIFGAGGGFGIFMTAFMSILGFMAALYLIKTWRGNP